MSGGLSLKSQVRLDPKWSGTDIGKHRIFFLLSYTFYRYVLPIRFTDTNMFYQYVLLIRFTNTFYQYVLRIRFTDMFYPYVLPISFTNTFTDTFTDTFYPIRFTDKFNRCPLEIFYFLIQRKLGKIIIIGEGGDFSLICSCNQKK